MPLPAVWRLLVSPPLDGPTNMALDHALAHSAGAGGPPTLRLYRWQPACLSLGYFQRLQADVNSAACAAAGVAVVRRPTGGRAILHADELTYSVTAGAATPGLNGRIVDSYRTISSALAAGLLLLDIAAAALPEAPASAKSAACFDTPGEYELTVGGRKLAGSAQTRTGRAILQHGTLLLSADAALLHSLLHLPPELPAGALAERLIALDEAAGRRIEFEEAAAALVAGFERAWGIRFLAAEPEAAEWSAAQQLRAQRYANPAWTARR